MTARRPRFATQTSTPRSPCRTRRAGRAVDRCVSRLQPHVPRLHAHAHAPTWTWTWTCTYMGVHMHMGMDTCPCACARARACACACPACNPTCPACNPTRPGGLLQRAATLRCAGHAVARQDDPPPPGCGGLLPLGGASLRLLLAVLHQRAARRLPLPNPNPNTDP